MLKLKTDEGTTSPHEESKIEHRQTTDSEIKPPAPFKAEPEPEGNEEDLKKIVALIKLKFGLQHVYYKYDPINTIYGVTFANSASFLAIDGYASKNKNAIEFLRANYQATLTYESSLSGLFKLSIVNFRANVAKILIRHLGNLPEKLHQTTVSINHLLESMKPDCRY